MTWIFIPSNCLPVSASLAKDCEPGSLTWAERLAPSLTLNGKLTRPASWRLACKKAAWMQHLSGATLPPSTLTNGLEPWIASLRASRAKTCHLQAAAPGLTASAAGCSLKSPALPVIAVRDTSFWRTSQASLLPPPPLWTKPKALLTNAQPPASWENWPTSGGMRSGSLFQRQTLVPATGGRGGFAGHGGQWLTPNCPNGGRSVSPELVASKGMTEDGQKRTVGLESQSKYWATPDCNSSTYSNGKMGPNIREQAAAWNANSAATNSPNTLADTDAQTAKDAGLMNWPTPAARDAKGENSVEHCTITGGGRKHMDQLSNFVAHFSHQAQPTQHGPGSSPDSHGLPQHSASKNSTTHRLLSRRLNPMFVENLMGWPLDWTSTHEHSASSAAATALWRHRLHLHLSALCAE